MRARGHAAGGLLAGLASATAASAADWIPGVADPTWWAVFATALFFALFPDVDTASLPQRWFYRGVVTALLWLAWSGMWQQATLLSVLAMLPLVDRHRGWTHARWSPLLMTGLLGGGYLWWRGVPEDGRFPAAEAAFAAAAVAGWYTHLILDGLFRVFPPDPA